VLAPFQKLPRCLIGIEACASAYHRSRELQTLGHPARPMPPAYVKPCVKRQKNDAADAEAICWWCRSRRASTRPRPLRSTVPRWNSPISVSIAPTRTSCCGRSFIDMYPFEAEDFIKKVIAMDWDRLIPGPPMATSGPDNMPDSQGLIDIVGGACSHLTNSPRFRPGDHVSGRPPPLSAQRAKP
jgi:hypothetical protein